MLNYERGQGDILLANTALEGLAKEIHITYRTAGLPGRHLSTGDGATEVNRVHAIGPLLPLPSASPDLNPALPSTSCLLVFSFPCGLPRTQEASITGSTTVTKSSCKYASNFICILCSVQELSVDDSVAQVQTVLKIVETGFLNVCS